MIRNSTGFRQTVIAIIRTIISKTDPIKKRWLQLNITHSWLWKNCQTVKSAKITYTSKTAAHFGKNIKCVKPAPCNPINRSIFDTISICFKNLGLFLKTDYKIHNKKINRRTKVAIYRSKDSTRNSMSVSFRSTFTSLNKSFLYSLQQKSKLEI